MRNLARCTLRIAVRSADLLVAVLDFAHERGIGVVEDVERCGHCLVCNSRRSCCRAMRQRVVASDDS